MKRIQILFYDPAINMVMITPDVELPYWEIDGKHEDTFDVAQLILSTYGYEAAGWIRIVNDPEMEMWQPIMVGPILDSEEDILEHHWITMDHIDPRTSDNSWLRKMFKKNLAVEIAVSLKKEHDRRVEEANRKGYVDNDNDEESKEADSVE